MERCLSEEALLLVHGEEGSENDRAHLDGCLSCARRYRRLANELDEIVAALKQPPPSLTASRRFSYSGRRWSLAAAAIILAFLCGRLTNFGVSNQSRVSLEQPADPDSAGQVEPSIQWLEANNAGIAAPASYGLYIDDLIAQDESDQNPGAADVNGDADSDDL
jgi:hypothetical protein